MSAISCVAVLGILVYLIPYWVYKITICIIKNIIESKELKKNLIRLEDKDGLYLKTKDGKLLKIKD